MAVEKLPPQDIDTESSCLASALLNREALYKVTEILHSEDFYLDKHRIIYDTILELEKKNLPIDLTTLKQRLLDNNLLDQIGGNAALAELYQSVTTTANAEYYAQRIKELSLRRKLINVASDSVERCYDMTLNTDELIDEVEQNIFNVTEKRVSSDFQCIENVLQQTLDDIGNWYETKQLVTGITSGFKDLDEMLTGFHASELLILAARPGMGKTALALNILNAVALQEKKPVLFFSLEMPATQLAMRMLCIESQVDSQKVRTGHISSEELQKLFQTSAKLAKAPIYIDDTPSVSILEMRAKCRRMHQKEPLGIIIVDYLQLITGNSRVDRQQQISEISRFLKQLARDLDVPVMALSQLSRAVEQRSDQIPTLADLRESGAIEQDADVVMFIYREEKVKKDCEESRKGVADVIIAKQRSGPVGTISLMFWQQYTKFGDLEKIHSYEETNPSHEIQ